MGNEYKTLPAKSQCYVSAARLWFSSLINEPQAAIKGSLLFLLCAIPIASLGPARLASVYYSGRRCESYIVTLKEAAAFGFGLGPRGATGAPDAAPACGIGAKGWLMGFTDMLAFMLAAGSAYALLNMDLPFALRLPYAVFFLLDIAYLASGVYRYPAMAQEPGAKLHLLALRGVLMAVGGPVWSFLFFCLQLLLLIVCALTGVGLLLIYPAGSALLSHCAYAEMVKHYAKNT